MLQIARLILYVTTTAIAVVFAAYFGGQYMTIDAQILAAPMLASVKLAMVWTYACFFLAAFSLGMISLITVFLHVRAMQDEM